MCVIHRAQIVAMLCNIAVIVITGIVVAPSNMAKTSFTVVGN